MQTILQINVIRSDEANRLAYEINVTQGALVLDTEEVLMAALANTVPGKKGIIDVKRISQSKWQITTNKNF